VELTLICRGEFQNLMEMSGNIRIIFRCKNLVAIETTHYTVTTPMKARLS